MISIFGYAITVVYLLGIPLMLGVLWMVSTMTDHYKKCVVEAGGYWSPPAWIDKADRYLGRNSVVPHIIVTLIVNLGMFVFMLAYTNSYTNERGFNFGYYESWVYGLNKICTGVGPIVGYIVVGVLVATLVAATIRFVARVNVAIDKNK